MNGQLKISDTKSFIGKLEILDFELLILLAVGSRQNIQNDISKKYNENKELYYLAYKNSNYYMDNRIKKRSFSNQKAIQQFIGIYLIEKAFNTHQDFTMKMVKSGYRFVFQYISNNKKVNFYKLRDKNLEITRKNEHDKTVNSAYIFGIALFICNKFDKIIEYDDFDIRMLKESISQVLFPVNGNLFLDKNNEARHYLEQYRSICLTKKSYKLPLNDTITAINHFLKLQMAKTRGIPLDDNETFNSLSEELDFFRGINIAANLLYRYNIDAIDLQNITTITQPILIDILSLCFLVKEEMKLKINIDELFGMYIIYYSLIQEYNLAKQDLLITSHEETLTELQHLKNEYLEKKKNIEEEQGICRNQYKFLENKYDEVLGKLNVAEKNLIKQEKQFEMLLKENEAYKNRNNNLIQQINMLNTVKKQVVLTENELANYIIKKTCAIIGGNINWQNNLKTYLPNCQFIEPDELGRDLHCLINMDVIFFNESFNSHSMFNKVKMISSINNIPFFFCGKNTNMKKTLESMYSSIKTM
ncbi:hypothetical protein [Sporosarcina sp. YIM B06819]|uniref:hypothetical protein n=1 Tax=Sporosarcina sp. YIM B06819 TaxID=3081769 RepID=UPI00298C7E48|nr:hypothetical protein [Sporosarcina sp. YIM B06819]